MFKCDECNKEFTTQGALNAHQISHKKGKRYSVSRKKTGTEYFTCFNCGTEHEKTSSTRNMFCSNICSGEYQRKQANEQIETGKVLSFATMRRYLFETRGVCEECGIGDTYNGKPITLQCDHIDGNSDNNALDNLRLLCPNCHSQTDTWCGRNTKNASRNKYARQWRQRVLNSDG